jgi:hypothetical protein
LLAEIKVAASGVPIDSAASNTVLKFHDPAAREQAAQLVSEAIGPCAIGAQSCVLLRKPVEQMEPLLWVLQADRTPTVKELAAFLPRNPITNSTLAWSQTSYLRVEAAPSNSFRLVLAEPVFGAADYLAWNEPLNADFDRVRTALGRPYARIDGNYEQPYGIPLVNFVAIRAIAQMLSQRAQTHLLLGDSPKAWHELALIRDLCGILGTKPPGKPVTLVAAMIEVAVTGLYTSVVEDGLRLRAWHEPELAAIERQLKDADLLESLVKALQAEQAGTTRTIEITRPGELARLFSLGSPGNLRQLMSSLGLLAMPRGWFYQNMVAGAALKQDWFGCVDLTNHLVLPHLATTILQKFDQTLRYPSPYTFLAATAQPNLLKALQTVARNQTLVNEARIACALERFRLAEGQYPASLNLLVPRFIDELPHDLIGGQALKFRRTDNGGFLLYSVGWDEKDDGGTVGNSREQGDWVWAKAQ